MTDMMDRKAVVAEIKAALRRRSGKDWSVTGGKGTAWGYIYVSAPPRRTGVALREGVEAARRIFAKLGEHENEEVSDNR
jgi:hypothetical protein